MGHNHEHHHHKHAPDISKINSAFIIGIVLNLIFVVVEFTAGWYNNSMALISDAGHNLVDVFSLVLALVAFRMAKVKSSETLTYGYNKTTILASLVNAILLFFVIGGIAWESFQRLLDPVEIEGSVTIIVASIGILINAVTAFLFFRDKDHDLNIKGAYLHLMADALVSLGVVIAGIVILFTDWFIIDTIMSFVIIIVIFLSSWSLFKDSFNLTIDGVPRNLDVKKIYDKVKKIPGVVDLHHLHVWAISTSINALTCHLVVEENKNQKEIAQIRHDAKHLISDMGIGHITLEVETESEDCHSPDC